MLPRARVGLQVTEDDELLCDALVLVRHMVTNRDEGEVQVGRRCRQQPVNDADAFSPHDQPWGCPTPHHHTLPWPPVLLDSPLP